MALRACVLSCEVGPVKLAAYSSFLPVSRSAASAALMQASTRFSIGVSAFSNKISSSLIRSTPPRACRVNCSRSSSKLRPITDLKMLMSRGRSYTPSCSRKPLIPNFGPGKAERNASEKPSFVSLIRPSIEILPKTVTSRAGMSRLKLTSG
ncbi:hypothetical protein D3C74_217250 [compost metagenome]